MPTIEVSDITLKLLNSERVDKEDNYDKIVQRKFAEIKLKDMELDAAYQRIKLYFMRDFERGIY